MEFEPVDLTRTGLKSFVLFMGIKYLKTKKKVIDKIFFIQLLVNEKLEFLAKN